MSYLSLVLGHPCTHKPMKTTIFAFFLFRHVHPMQLPQVFVATMILWLSIFTVWPLNCSLWLHMVNCTFWPRLLCARWGQNVAISLQADEPGWYGREKVNLLMFVKEIVLQDCSPDLWQRWGADTPRKVSLPEIILFPACQHADHSRRVNTEKRQIHPFLSNHPGENASY